MQCILDYCQLLLQSHEWCTMAGSASTVAVLRVGLTVPAGLASSGTRPHSRFIDNEAAPRLCDGLAGESPLGEADSATAVDDNTNEHRKDGCGGACARACARPGPHQHACTCEHVRALPLCRAGLAALLTFTFSTRPPDRPTRLVCLACHLLQPMAVQAASLAKQVKAAELKVDEFSGPPPSSAPLLSPLLPSQSR